MAFALFAYQVGKPTDRTASYYQGRFTFYTVLVTLAGLSQFLLGSFATARFGSGPLAPPIGVAMYVVHFPGLNILVGLVQLLTGVFGILRRYGYFVAGKEDNRYQNAIFLVWLLQLSVQILAQVGYAPEGMLAPAAPTIACLSLGMNVIAAFLEYKMRTMPLVLPADYYGGISSDGNIVLPIKSIQDESEEFNGNIAKEMVNDTHQKTSEDEVVSVASEYDV